MSRRVRAFQFLGRASANPDEEREVLVFYVQYHSSVNGGCMQAAKLFLPAGKSPDGGWPTSIWCHGLGDPATQLSRWPLVGQNWVNTRGELAGRWAHHGIATLTPWLPGDGPSEPLASYSPLSLERNSQAVFDSMAALKELGITLRACF